MSAAAAIDAYMRAVEADPGAAREQAEWLSDAFARRGVTYGGSPMRTFLRPHFVSGADWERLRGDGRRVLELAARAARHAFDGDVGRLAAFLGMPEAEARWVAIDRGEPDVVWSRLDAFVTPAGPRFVEINNDAPAGFGYGDRMAELFRELPIFREFARTHPVVYPASSPGLVAAALGYWRLRGGGGEPTVAIVDWAEVPTRADQEILREAFAARGLRCFLADPRELQRIDGRLWRGDDHVELVFRRALLPELLDRSDEARDLLEAYRRDEAVFFNPFRCRLSENKAFFAVLTDEEFSRLFSEEERALLASAVPWTRRVGERKTRRGDEVVDLVPHVLEHREELVLKPAHGSGGRSVRVGAETVPADWERAVGEALSSPWVVQEHVAIPKESFPVLEGRRLDVRSLYVNSNPFYAAAEPVGAVARASGSPVINVSAGGGSVPTFALA